MTCETEGNGTDHSCHRTADSHLNFPPVTPPNQSQPRRPTTPCQYCGGWHYNIQCPQNPYRQGNAQRVGRGQQITASEERTIHSADHDTVNSSPSRHACSPPPIIDAPDSGRSTPEIQDPFLNLDVDALLQDINTIAITPTLAPTLNIRLNGSPCKPSSTWEAQSSPSARTYSRTSPPIERARKDSP